MGANALPVATPMLQKKYEKLIEQSRKKKLKSSKIIIFNNITKMLAKMTTGKTAQKHQTSRQPILGQRTNH